MLLEIIYAVLRSVFAFVLLMIVIRCMGRKAIAEMTYFDFGIALALGSITANIGFGNDRTLHSTVAVLLTFGALGVLTGILHIKFFPFSKLINSEPLVIIENGEIIKANMQKVRMSLTELTALLREKDAFNIGDVQYAIFESDGKLSVLPRADKMPLTPSDMQLHPADKGLTKELVINGKIMAENLKALNLTEEWLRNALKAQGFDQVTEVFFAALDSSGGLYVSRGGGKTERAGQHGIE